MRVGPATGSRVDRAAVDVNVGQVQVHARQLLRGGLVAVADGLEAHERGAGLDLAAGGHEQLPDPGGERRGQDGLHLHRLEHQHGRARGDLVAHRHRGGDDQRRGGGAQHAALVEADPVGDPVDLDELDGAVRGGDQPVLAAADGDAGGVVVDAVELGLDGVLAGGGGDGDAEPVRRHARHGQRVGRAAQRELDLAPRGVLQLGAAAARRLEQASAGDRLVGLVGLDPGRHQGDPGVTVAAEPALAADPVDPAGVGAAVDHLGGVEQLEDEALVGGAALDDDGGLLHGAAQAGESLVPVAAGGDDLGDHRVEVGGDRVALGDTRVDADAGARRQLEQGDAAR